MLRKTVRTKGYTVCCQLLFMIPWQIIDDVSIVAHSWCIISTVKGKHNRVGQFEHQPSPYLSYCQMILESGIIKLFHNFIGFIDTVVNWIAAVFFHILKQRKPIQNKSIIQLCLFWCGLVKFKCSGHTNPMQPL